MLIATWNQAAQFLVPAAFGYVLAAVLFWACGRMASTARAAERAALRVAQIALVLVAWLGAPYVLIGVAAIGCRPNDYECPV